MTATTTDKEVAPQDALGAAEARYRSTQGAADVAHAAASRQALDEAEAAAAQAIAAAITGDGDRATVDAARARVEQLRNDHEWAQVELQAAETAMARAYDDVVRARRGVVAEEIVKAHQIHNNPKTGLTSFSHSCPPCCLSSPRWSPSGTSYTVASARNSTTCRTKRGRIFPPANPSQRRTRVLRRTSWLRFPAAPSLTPSQPASHRPRPKPKREPAHCARRGVKTGRRGSPPGQRGDQGRCAPEVLNS